MKRLFALILVLVLILNFSCAQVESSLGYRFADAQEGAALMLANRDYFENLTQNDLNFRLQQLDATLEALEAYSATQVEDYTDEEKTAIDKAMADIEQIAADRGYTLPPMDDIVFIKTTMREECNASAYTHGTQIYMGEGVLSYGCSTDERKRTIFYNTVAHELFHCLTRSHPDFRAAMYGVLGFSIGGECAFSEAIRARIISNPDVEHHDAYATFIIDGQPRECVVMFTTSKPFEQPGDRFFNDKVTGLVPLDDPSTMYTSEDAENFRDVFGRNTAYVIDPEETLADNFALTIIYGPEQLDKYKSPEIILAIDALLKESQ